METPLKYYPGSKNNSGILQFLINRIPYHHAYYELFAGSAQLYYNKKPAAHNVLMDRSTEVMNEHKKIVQDRTAINCYTGDSVDFLRSVQSNLDRECFIYLDPPYPLSSRKGRKYYKYEMTDDDHVQLLNTIGTMDANIMISTRQNELYQLYLKDWRKDEFATADRGGAATEIVYMNYEHPTFLHQYDYLGDGYIKRQAMKRKRDSFLNKLKKLPAYERHMLIQQMIAVNEPEVQHFLSMSANIVENDITKNVLPIQPGGTVDNVLAAAGIICHYCQIDPGTNPNNTTLFNGFYDGDMQINVCNKCKSKHYQHKQSTEYKNLYTEFPVMANNTG